MSIFCCKNLFFLILLHSFLLTGITSAADEAKQGEPLPDPSKVQPALVATGFAPAEGLHFDKEGNLFACNYRVVGTIGKLTPDGTASVYSNLRSFRSRDGRQARPADLVVDASNRLIIADAGAGRLLRLAESNKLEIISERFLGARYNSITKLALDPEGNVYFVDAGDSRTSNPTGTIYRYNIMTGRIQLLASGFSFPDGIAIAPDGKKICIAESNLFRVVVYDLDANGQMVNRSVLVTFPLTDKEAKERKIEGKDWVFGKFAPNDLAFDAAGRLYVAMRGGGVVNVIEVSTGKWLQQYKTTGKNVTTCEFYDKQPYVTLEEKEAIFQLPLGVKGYHSNGSGRPTRPVIPRARRIFSGL